MKFPTFSGVSLHEIYLIFVKIAALHIFKKIVVITFSDLIFIEVDDLQGYFQVHCINFKIPPYETSGRPAY